jgi:hypothetical protein
MRKGKELGEGGRGGSNINMGITSHSFRDLGLADRGEGGGGDKFGEQTVIVMASNSAVYVEDPQMES